MLGQVESDPYHFPLLWAYRSDLKFKKPVSLGFSVGTTMIMIYIFKSFWKYTNGGLPRIKLGEFQFLSYIICQLLSYYCSISDFPFIENHAYKNTIDKWLHNQLLLTSSSTVFFFSNLRTKGVVFKWCFASMEGVSSDFSFAYVSKWVGFVFEYKEFGVLLLHGLWVYLYDLWYVKLQRA